MDDDAERLLDQLQGLDPADRESKLRLLEQLRLGSHTAVDWCEAAGQSEPLTTRLKNLLKDYPADVGLFKEMVQNADDAGATRVHFVWDQRKNQSRRLLTPEMARWQGSCLWAFNDAIFTEQDFEAICRLGVGGKRRETARIGRFGLGFNSVYNLTDVPSILSNDVVLFLDPHVQNLKDMGASTQKPGIKMKFMKINVLEKFPDQFRPYHRLLGCDLASSGQPFQGTLIRIPFRTPETAASSEISNIVVDAAMMETLLQQFQSEAFQWLLFLQNVREITISRVDVNNGDGSPMLETLGVVSLGRSDQRSIRPSIVTCGPGEKWGSVASGSSPSNVTATIDIRCELARLTASTAPSPEAAIRRYHLFTDTRHSFSSRVCLAVPLARDRDAVADLSRHEEDGRVFCFLPLPRNIDLGIRVHVHAPLNMAQDRRSVLLDERVGESERELVQHNCQLLDNLVPTALLACLTDLAVRRNQTPPARFFGLFPSLLGRSAAGAPAERVAHTFYKRLVTAGRGPEDPRPPLPVASPSRSSDGASPKAAQTRAEAPPNHWVPFAEAIFVPSVDAASNGDSGNGSRTTAVHTPQRLVDQVVQQLLIAGVSLVDAPAHVLESIERALRPKHATKLTPRWLRQYLRQQAAGQTVLPLKGNNGAHGFFAEMTAEDIANFLEFALSDGDVADLAGVPLLLCEDEEAVLVFRTEAKTPPAFVPDGEAERRLFPRSRDGRRCLLASRLEKRNVVWAQLRELAQAHRDQKGSGSRPCFQCRLIDFQLLVEALQRLLPRTWNEACPRVTLADWNDWVEDWLKALWRWLELKGISLSRMAHWPIIPSIKASGTPCLHRIPETNKQLLFSVANIATTQHVNEPRSSEQSSAGSRQTPDATDTTPPKPTASNETIAASPPPQKLPSHNEAMADLLEHRLRCIPVCEPAWLLQSHEKELRCHVHAGTPEGFLRAMHVALKMGILGQSEKRQSNAAAQPKQEHVWINGLRAALSDGLSAGQLRALVVTTALAQRSGCSCESSQALDWKCRCDVVRSLPLFCKFNVPELGVALHDTRKPEASSWTSLPIGLGGNDTVATWSLLPEICPEAVAALRAVSVELPGCVEIPLRVLEGLAEADANVVVSLLRELALPRLRWSNVLLDHVFPWAQNSKDLAAIQSLMLAVVSRWRDMELSGNDRCIEALQHVPFVSTIGGHVLCPDQVLDPAVEELRLLYGSDGSTGPFPDVRFLSVECRQILRYRRQLSYKELTERIMSLHEFEIERRASEHEKQEASVIEGKSSSKAVQDIIPIAEALVRYIIQHIAPAMSSLDEPKKPPPPPPPAPAPAPAPPPSAKHEKQETKSSFSWAGFTDMFSSTFETAANIMPSMSSSTATSNTDAIAPKPPRGALSDDDLFSLRTKLQGCAWLPAAPTSEGWPTKAPWRGRGCGLCFAAEVRLASEEFLVGMVRPLVGPRAARSGSVSSSAGGQSQGGSAAHEVAARIVLPRSFLDILQLKEQPPKELLREQLSCIETWVQTLPENELDIHRAWISKCLYDCLYPALLPNIGDVSFVEESLESLMKAIWVPHGGFVPPSRISKQTIDFPPYLVRAPVEWREKLPWLWSKIKDVFTVSDCAEALQCIHSAQNKAGAETLDDNMLDLAVRLVMAITDLVKKEREAGIASLSSVTEQVKILMPTHDGTLRPVEECVFNNMTWLPDVETSELSLGSFCLVHANISHAVAHTCGCRGLSLVYAREATEMTGADWFEAAGQSEPMTTRLKNLLKDYPADISIFKEMVQNADDAGATKVHFVWDWRQFRKQSLLTLDMDRWQGPALWVYNNATFSQRDFESICRLGVGGKREATAKIGRFGLGFNCAYNLTDLPSILSDDVVLFLDPHVRHLQGMGATVQKPGIKMKFLKINVLEKFRDQFEPYHGLLGCDLSSSAPFAGTLFRIPFRTAETAKVSEVSNIVVDHSVAEALCGQFQSEAHQWLLFLSNVVDIEVSEIGEGHVGGPPILKSIARVKLRLDEPIPRNPLANADNSFDPNEVEADAEKFSDAIEVAASQSLPQSTRPHIKEAGADGPATPENLTIESSLPGSSSCLIHHYRLVSGLAKDMEQQVCIAVPLQHLPQNAQDTTLATVSLAREEGRIFAFLPLPRSAVSLRLPVHVHAPVNTAQDRRSVLLDDRIGAREQIQHNMRLLDQRIPECLFRCICDLSKKASAKDLFQLFPVLNLGVGREQATGDSGVAERVAHAFYKMLISPRSTERIFPVVSSIVDANALPDWRVAFREAVFFHQRDTTDTGTTNHALVREVAVLLSRFGVPVVEVPQRLLESLERVLHPAQPLILTPLWLRQFLRAVSAPRDGKKQLPSFPVVEKAPDGAADKEQLMRRNHVPGHPVQVSYLTCAEASALLEFALADNDVGDLEGVPLLVTECLESGTQAFRTEGGPTIFIPEDEMEYGVLPQAPSRLINRGMRKFRPRVWQQLRHMASESQTPQRSDTDTTPAYQLRKVAFEPVIDALQGLLPQSWNAPAPEVPVADWNEWVELWLKAMWKWMARMNMPMKKLMHWPLVPNVQYGAATDVAEESKAASEGSAPCIQKVNLHRLSPNSMLFSAAAVVRDAVEEASSVAGADTTMLQSDLWEIGAGSTHSVRKTVAKILEERLKCVVVWEPEWMLRDHEKAIREFVQAGTPEGMLKTVHHFLLQREAKKGNAKQDPNEQYNAALLRARRAFDNNLTGPELTALAVWMGLVQRDGCSCPSAGTPTWKPSCKAVRLIPLFCPFAHPDKRVALVDFETNGTAKTMEEDETHTQNWVTLPSTCPEVVAALRAAGVELGSVVEVPTALESGGNRSSGAVVEAVAALMKELSLARLTWAEVMLQYGFPWVGNTVDASARQGLMMAVVRRWREMELAGNETCMEALQEVPFVTTVGGEVMSPSQLLDPSADELRRLYAQDGTAGPFPSPEIYTMFSSGAQKGLLKFRRELTVPELVERLTYLHKHADSSENMATIEAIAGSLLQYIADHAVEKCAISAEGGAASDAAHESSGKQKSSSAAFFIWPSAMRGMGTMMGGGSEPIIEWREDEVEMLKAKVRACNWIPAAKPPREWLSMAPWAGSAGKLWRADQLRLMPQFMTCGAAMPLLCPETQLGISTDRKAKVQSMLLSLLGIQVLMDHAELRRVAWAQLEAIHEWWKSAGIETQFRDRVLSWLTNCLYSHVYPFLEPRPPPPPMPPSSGAEANSPKEIDLARPKESKVLSQLFIDGNFVELDDISLEQGFPVAGLHQLPAGIRGIHTIRCLIKPSFNTRDCGRALENLKNRLTAENRPQLSPQEVEAAVRLAIALAERVRTCDESLPRKVLVPTSRGTLCAAHDCVYNNMKWLSPEEQQKRSKVVTDSGLEWVHASVSNEVAATLQVRGLNAQVAAEAMGNSGDNGDDESSWFEAAGQAEPLTTRLRFLLQDMNEGTTASYLSIFKELLQNADDASATEVHFVWDWRRFGTQSLMSPEMARWQGPCLWAHNNSSFSQQDFENITQLGAMGKMAGRGRSRGVSHIGRFGLGFNSVYNFTDLPSILSDEQALFLDPHVRHLRDMKATALKPGVRLRFLKIDVLDKFRDQFEPYHGLFGCDLASSSPYPGTLIRIPFRTPEAARTSEISNFVMTYGRASETLMAFRAAAAECLIFLQHVKTIKFCWIPQDAGPKAQPDTILEVCIQPPKVDLDASVDSTATAAAAAKPSGTDAQALECRRLFSSRTLPQSRERRSFITSLLGRIGLSYVDPSTEMQEAEEQNQSVAAFNLSVSLKWATQQVPGGFSWPPRRPEGQQIDVWRLFLRHEDAESLGFSTGVAPPAAPVENTATLSGPSAPPADDSRSVGGDFVPFAGIALCLTRPLRPEEPRISCFLPLPVQSSLPFLVNANFMLSDPTSSSRLDLATNAGAGNSGKGAAWNRLLLDKLIIPMVQACIKEQARGLHAMKKSASTDFPCAQWAQNNGGICTFMPTRAQLPPSFKELLDLSTLYMGLGTVPLFPPIDVAAPPVQATSTQQQLLALPNSLSTPPLLSFTTSVQPLAVDAMSEGLRQSVHEYMRDAGPFQLCDVRPDVGGEFASAGIERQAVLSQSLVADRLRGGRRPKNAKMSAELLSYLLAGDLGQDPASVLRGLPLAALCDGTVADLGDANKRLWCAFPGGPAQEIAANAQFVLEHLSAQSTLDLNMISASAAAVLSRCAEPLGITNVIACEKLAEAIRESGSSLCMRKPGNAATVAKSMAAAATAFMGSILGSGVGSHHNECVSANALGMGNAQQANAIICSLWNFAQLADGGLGEEFLKNFTDFYIVPAADAELLAPPMGTSKPSSSASAASDATPLEESVDANGSSSVSSRTRSLDLLPLSIERPLLLSPSSDELRNGNTLAVFKTACCILFDRFVDVSHPALEGPVIQFLLDRGAARLVKYSAILAVLAASMKAENGSYKAVVGRCGRLTIKQKMDLCNELSSAFCTVASQNAGSSDTLKPYAAAFCGLPVFLSEAGATRMRGTASEDGVAGGVHGEEARGGPSAAAPMGDARTEKAFRALSDLCVIDGEPLYLADPPSRLDLTDGFVFRQSPHTSPALAEALGQAEVQEHMKGLNHFLSPVDWLLAHVVPHMPDLKPDDQVAVLERLLPDLADDQANSHAGLVPAEVQGGGSLLKAPYALLDAQDFLIQEVFGLGGNGTPDALPRTSRLHFPAKYLSTSVRAQLRRLGMRQSANDAPCLVFLTQELRNRQATLEAQRYGELQRSLFQRVVESWGNLSGQAQQALLAEPFISISAEADGGELPESLFALRPYRDQCAGRLLCLGDLISRNDIVDPYLCWTSAPLCPRSFPAFVGYRKPSLAMVVTHAKSLGELADSGSVSCHMWTEMREKVIAPLCEFLANSDPFRVKLLPSAAPAVGDSPDGVPAAPPEAVGEEAARDDANKAMERNRICAQLRRTKFLAVPLDASEMGPHALVAPWRISLVLREHRPPMFALPGYLQEHVELLRLLGVRDALEVPPSGGGGSSGTDKDATLAAETAMRWLFENGAESFADVTVHCDGGSLFLHRNILMARSDYFRAMFQGGEFGFREGREGGAEVHLLEATKDVAQVIFGYLYHGRVDEAPLEGPEGTSNAVDLLRLADQLGVPQLFEFAQLWVANQQDLEDCPTTLELASRHRAEILEKATLSLMAANMDAPEVEQQLPHLSDEHREALLGMVAQRPRRSQ